jgi:broad specificity phosphatase PhoE
MKIYLLRHLPTTDTEQGINGSQTDTPLSESSLQRAQELVPKLSKHTYDLFIVSPLIRTRQTIQPFLETLDETNVIEEPLTIERDLGRLTNTRKGDGKIEKSQQDQGGDTIAWTPLEGESILDVYERAKQFLEKLKIMDAESVLISGHQNFLRNLELVLLDRSPYEFYSEQPPLLENGEMREYSY